jgi:predicted dinucleotide-binding enzyme
MAVGLGAGWVRAGHDVVLGSRDPAARRRVAAEVGVGASVASINDALSAAEIVILAIPYRAAESFARTHAAALRSIPLVDITNPFDNLPDNAISGAEITARAIGKGGRVLAAFKDNFARTLLDPVDPGVMPRDVHYAGDDPEAKAILAGLIQDLGFKPVDCGPLRNARILDGMVTLMIELDRRYSGGNGKTSWKFLG